MKNLFLILFLLIVCVWCQSQDQDSSQDSVGQTDPNLVNPQNRQGYGRNVQTQLLPPPKTTPTSKPPTPVENSVEEQSVQAALQLGVLVGVALLCGVLFLIVIGVELACGAIKEKINDCFGRKKIYEVEDPASLVGTFKRYK